MRSFANFRSHPLHPMLVAFPVAFLTGTLIFDVLGIILENKEFHDAAYYMQIAGILGGLIAAIPGVLDYMTVIPPDSTGKKRATKHAILNVLTLLLFFVAWMLKENESNILAAFGLEFVGVIIMSIAGWMGGTLVYRNQIAVDHRYANAGKWKDENIDDKGSDTVVAVKDELGSDQMKLIRLNGKRIVIGKTETGYVAFEDRCTHRGGSLADGVLICGTVQCPWHGSQFDVRTGEVKAGPAKEKINIYNVTERDNKVYITLNS